MRKPTDEQIEGLLVNVLTAGFNRSIGALARAGALDTRKMHRKYTGVGSEYYDLVTEQIEYTARAAVRGVRLLFIEPGEEHSDSEG